ncbi:MAG: outer membrane protein assembly factor [Cyclobacteriaceae bacterium]|jgi:hypothetical protein|nr:outer membrane protein assembly factor [Cyclobacteriaceae bacterium]
MRFVFLFFASLQLALANDSDTVVRNKKIQFVPVPNLGTSPETGFFYGANATALFKVGNRDSLSRTSNASIDILRTQAHQSYVGLEYNLFLANEKYMARGTNEVFDFNLNYFGIGPKAANQFEPFAFTQILLDNNLFIRLKKNNYVGLGYRYHFWRLNDYRPGGLLDTDNVLGYRRSVSSGINLTYLLDSRDNIVNTYRGTLVSASLTANATWMGSTFNNPAVALEAAHFVPTFTERHVLALHTLASLNFGDVPFSEYNLLGGENIKRGFYNGRFRDQQFAAGQVEYRFPVYKRLGMVAFTSIGSVAREVTTFDASYLKVAGGGGLRYTLSKKERFNLRIDYGMGYESGFLYIGVGEAF